jgi:hypothetical protein
MNEEMADGTANATATEGGIEETQNKDNFHATVETLVVELELEPRRGLQTPQRRTGRLVRDSSKDDEGYTYI